MINYLFTSCDNVRKKDERQLIEIAHEPGSPITNDSRTGEYLLTYDIVTEGQLVKRYFVLKFSPFTGASLPSRRADLFTTPSRAEIVSVIRGLGNAKSLSDVEKQIGKPDRIHTNESTGSLQYKYKNIGKTFDLVVEQSSDGRIRVFTSGKPKGTSDGDPAQHAE